MSTNASAWEAMLVGAIGAAIAWVYVCLQERINTWICAITGEIDEPSGD